MDMFSLTSSPLSVLCFILAVAPSGKSEAPRVTRDLTPFHMVQGTVSIYPTENGKFFSFPAHIQNLIISTICCVTDKEKGSCQKRVV